MIRNRYLKFFAVPAVLLAGAANAADPYAAITAAVDFDGVTPVIIAAAAALAVILVLRKGVRFALSMVK